MNYIRLFLSNQLVSVEGPCERRTSNAMVETVKRTIVGLKSSRCDDYLCKIACAVCVLKTAVRRTKTTMLQELSSIHVNMTDHYVADHSSGETDYGPSPEPSLGDLRRTGNPCSLANRSIDYHFS